MAVLPWVVPVSRTGTARQAEAALLSSSLSSGSLQTRSRNRAAAITPIAGQYREAGVDRLIATGRHIERAEQEDAHAAVQAA